MCTANELTFEQIKETLNNQIKKDYIVDPSYILPVTDMDMTSLTIDFGTNVHTTPNDNMLKQMDTALMPGFGTYGESLRDNQMLCLYTDNLNQLLPRLAVPRMIRTVVKDTEQISRAFLSNRYERIDDLDTINCLMKAVDKHKETKYEHKGGYVTSLHTYMKMLTDNVVIKMTDDNGNKKEFKMGFLFSNSEVGLGCCRLNMFVHEINTGSNFIIETEVGKVRYVHHGKAFNLDEDEIARELEAPKVDSGKLLTIQNDLYEAIDIVSDPDNLKGFFDTLQASYNLHMDLEHSDDVVKYMDVIGKNLGISKLEQEAVVGRLLATGDTTLYGIFEAISHLAKYAKSYERRIELETLSGKAVTTLPRRWKAITQMAKAK